MEQCQMVTDSQGISKRLVNQRKVMECKLQAPQIPTAEESLLSVMLVSGVLGA